MFFDKIGKIQRLLETETDKESYADLAGFQNFRIQVQPSNNETTALSNGVFGKTYSIYTLKAGIKDGDRITVSGLFVDNISLNKQLQVINVNNWYFQPLPHFVITCGDIEE